MGWKPMPPLFKLLKHAPSAYPQTCVLAHWLLLSSRGRRVRRRRRRRLAGLASLSLASRCRRPRPTNGADQNTGFWDRLLQRFSKVFRETRSVSRKSETWRLCAWLSRIAIHAAKPFASHYRSPPCRARAAAPSSPAVSPRAEGSMRMPSRGIIWTRRATADLTVSNKRGPMPATPPPNTIRSG